MVRSPGHQVTIAEGKEALADTDARLFDPDPNSKHGTSARVIGYSPTAVAVLLVILVHREVKPSAWWGANGWRANRTDRRIYMEKENCHEQGREQARRAGRRRGRCDS